MQSKADFNLSFYPNPANDIINISSSDASINKIDFYDLQGRLIKTALITQGNNSVDISLLPNGVFIYIVSDQFSNTITGKLNIIR
ncbi:MAG: T9SS type A sorting domain-containing protein [Bacteroidia bacterium]